MKKRSKIILAIFLVVAAVAVMASLSRGRLVWFVYRAADALPTSRAPVAEPGLISDKTEPVTDIQTVATGLEVPWEIAFLPDGGMLVTERPGRLAIVTKDGTRAASYDVMDVKATGEGGLMGMALHPDYANNGRLYLCYTTGRDGGTTNRIDRYRLGAEGLSDRTEIILQIPGAIYHDGCRLGFGPDGKLYASFGDATVTSNAQDRGSLAGKILRLNDDGTIPQDNPFGDAVWSYGHRNPQGIAWDADGRLWSTEHGRSGAQSGFDEVNLIERGRNYGWPTIQGDAESAGMEAPKANSGPSETWAPSGVAYLNGSLFFAGLRGEALYEARLDGGRVTGVTAHFKGTYGRLRAVRTGPDGWLYVSTSNRDGRGNVKGGDDRILKINPTIFDKRPE